MMQNIYVLRSAKFHAATRTYVDRGVIQSLVKIADDPVIIGTVDSKKKNNVGFLGRGSRRANEPFDLLFRHNITL